MEPLKFLFYFWIPRGFHHIGSFKNRNFRICSKNDKFSTKNLKFRIIFCPPQVQHRSSVHKPLGKLFGFGSLYCSNSMSMSMFISTQVWEYQSFLNDFPEVDYERDFYKRFYLRNFFGQFDYQQFRGWI